MKLIPRLRMFAGPNGSGKSTIKNLVPSQLLGVYINPDEIEKELKTNGCLDLSIYQIEPSDTKDLVTCLKKSVLLEKAGLLGFVSEITCSNGLLEFNNVPVNSYFASVIASFIREKLLDNKVSFTFETVMSSPDKTEFLEKARQKGFRTYLYFIATEDPDINISRVKYRVESGGHPVPTDKIVSRYYRSLSLLPQAVKNTDRAYFFDNSGSESIYIAELENGTELKFNTNLIPVWFNSFIEQIST